MSETKRGKNPVFVQWIGDVCSVDKHGILALLYPDQQSLEDGRDIATLEVPREQITDEMWGMITECAILQCSLGIEAPIDAHGDPVVTDVYDITFDPQYSASLNQAVLTR